MTWDDVIRLAATLPGVEVSTSYGTPALKRNGKLLTRLRDEDNSLVLLDVVADERDMLITAEPALFHTMPHYAGYSTVLARLAALDERTLLPFLERRWRTCGTRPKKARGVAS